MKKTIAAFLALLLFVSCLPIKAAQATEETQEEQYSENDLAQMIYDYYLKDFYEKAEPREFDNPELRVPNPRIHDPEQLYRNMYIPRYKNLNMDLHERAMMHYHFPPVILTGDILPIDVKDPQQLREKAGIASYGNVKCAAELISVDETVPFRMVLVTVKDQKHTKSICQEMVYNMDLSQWSDVENLNAAVFGIHGEITMIILEESLFADYAPYFSKWARTELKNYVDTMEYWLLNPYSLDNWTRFSWKLNP